MRIVWFQKMSILSTQKGLEIPGSGRDLKGQKLYGNIRRLIGCVCVWGGGGVLRKKNQFYGDGMDNLWNYTVHQMFYAKLSH